MSTYFGSLGVELSSFLGGVLQSLDRNLVYAIAGKKKGTQIHSRFFSFEVLAP